MQNHIFLFLSGPCDPSWRYTRDGLTYSGLAFSIVALFVPFIALFIQFLLWKSN